MRRGGNITSHLWGKSVDSLPQFRGIAPGMPWRRTVERKGESMDLQSKDIRTEIAGLRLFARGLGLLISGLFLYMFIAESWDGHVRNGASGLLDLKPIAVIGLGLMGVYIIAMFLALKWEHAGTLMAVGALGAFFLLLFFGLFPGNVSGGFSLRGILNPFLWRFRCPSSCTCSVGGWKNGKGRDRSDFQQR